MMERSELVIVLSSARLQSNQETLLASNRRLDSTHRRLSRTSDLIRSAERVMSRSAGSLVQCFEIFGGPAKDGLAPDSDLEPGFASSIPAVRTAVR